MGRERLQESPVFVCVAGAVCWPGGGVRRPPAFAPGGGGRRPPPTGRDFAPAESFFLMFWDKERHESFKIFLGFEISFSPVQFIISITYIQDRPITDCCTGQYQLYQQMPVLVQYYFSCRYLADSDISTSVRVLMNTTLKSASKLPWLFC